MTPPLAILRGHERAAWLSGPRAVIDAIAAASGLVARSPHGDAAAGGGYSRGKGFRNGLPRDCRTVRRLHHARKSTVRAEGWRR